jgi:toxin ParE1/3/4
MTVAYSAIALADLEAIEAYIEAKSPGKSIRVIREIIDTIDLIARHPGVGRPMPRRPAVRRIPTRYYPYMVYFATTEDGLMVLHVRHTSRRVPKRYDLGL